MLTRCSAHPDLDAQTACERCGGFFCAACLRNAGPGLLCARCWGRYLDEDPPNPGRTALVVAVLGLAFPPVAPVALWLGWRATSSARAGRASATEASGNWAIRLACISMVIASFAVAWFFPP
jgi:hypothetical protein